MRRILIIDDDKALCRSMQIQLGTKGFEVQCIHTGNEGLQKIGAWRPELVFLDLMLPDQTGLDLLRTLGEKTQDFSIVMITGTQDTQNVIDAMQLGAFDYIRKPLNIDDIFLVVEKVRGFIDGRAAVERDETGSADAPQPLPSENDHREIVGKDEQILDLLKQIGVLSRSDVTVLVEGESGTGKELVARALHNASRPGKPFVAINCSSIVSTLPESELFGHEKGAFTGASKRKIGKLEYAGEGTVFLDEIGDLALDLQAKLLRVLQENEFERVGGLEMIPFPARVIAATNRNLAAMVQTGEFRNDLFYRLAVSRLEVPPLRDRPDDIPMLVAHLVGNIAGHLHKRGPVIEAAALSALQMYNWPGNVRELENVLTRAILLSRGGALSASTIKFALGTGGGATSINPAPGGGATSIHPAPGESTGTAAIVVEADILPLREAEKRYIQSVLQIMDWNITHSARQLEISPTTLRKKITDYELRQP